MYKVLYIKLQNNEGSSVTIKVWKVQSLNHLVDLADHYSNTSLFSLAVFIDEAYFISTCVEGFLFGKLCALTCTLAQEVQLFPCLGLYSGIFALYLQCPSKRSGTALILFYAVCLLYVLSTASFVSDLVYLIIFVSNNSICKNTFLYISCADASPDTTASTSI